MTDIELARLLAGLPLPAMLISGTERVQACNSLAIALLGEGIVGRHPAIAVRAPGVLEAIGKVGPDTPPQETRMSLRREGQEEVFQVTVSSLRDGLVLCIFRDVTEEEKAGEMRRDFVANVSHELRTPLTALMGFIETLKHAARDDPKAREVFLGIMEAEAGRMNRLVRDLLHLSRVEAEERVRPREPVELRGLLEGVISSLRGMAEREGDRVELTGDPVTVPGDWDQLVQVFTNLVENALKYGAAGQVVRVSLTPEETVRGPAVRVEVADEGEGIDPVHIPRLTERFYRVDTHRSREMGGTGLGLAIVKHIVSRHRGWLRIESEKGRGSRFQVVLPLG
ncbi:sensor histidine kinase [Rhodobacter calidifons]|uniref:histidine kinase n=1 Tax=Rhodobacter calidifons TaxID=2715277 RepID=A0ABX0G7P5_9RHOB|nr:ATP-binding protein [Rhodobacter calidifons]NHB77244.1 two-component sensor histidine kinase [Rhodobacter calidifons]